MREIIMDPSVPKFRRLDGGVLEYAWDHIGPGALMVANGCDRPCKRLICELVEPWEENSEYWWMRYVGTRVSKNRLMSNLDYATPIAAFGVRVLVEGSTYSVLEGERPTDAAKYKNGDDRFWQPEDRECDGWALYKGSALYEDSRDWLNGKA